MNADFLKISLNKSKGKRFLRPQRKKANPLNVLLDVLFVCLLPSTLTFKNVMYFIQLVLFTFIYNTLWFIILFECVNICTTINLFCEIEK